MLSPREVAARALDVAARGQQICIIFGNEKTGLSREELARAEVMLRIPMAADQPSVNLAQAVQIVAYELFAAALAERETDA